MKFCAKCHILKPFEAFNKNLNLKDGLTAQCSECLTARQKRKLTRNQQLFLEGKAYCPRCKQEKNILEFGSSQANVNGLANYCKDCVRIKTAEQKAKNPRPYKNGTKWAKPITEQGLLAKENKHRCAECKQVKSFDDFHKAKRSKYGVASYCKDCTFLKTMPYKSDKYKERKELAAKGLKRCQDCQRILAYAYFSSRGTNRINHSDGLRGTCKECQREKRTYEPLTPEQALIQFDRYLRRVYHIDLIQYNKLLVLQNYACAICLSVNPQTKGAYFVIDHNHLCCPGNKNLQSCGKCIRGLLCKNCNWLLGQAKDSVLIMKNAINYLEGSNHGAVFRAIIEPGTIKPYSDEFV